MTIKQSLILAFGVFILIIFFLCVSLLQITKKNQMLIDKSLKNYEKLVLYRDILFFFEKQTRSLDFFLVLGEESEKTKWYESSLEVRKKLEGTEVENLYQKIYALSRNVFKNYKTGALGQALLISREVAKLSDDFLNKINLKIKLYLQNLNISRQEMENLQIESQLFSLSVTVISFMIGIILSILLFRLIARPIYKLVDSTQIIGSGNLEHHINIKIPKETATLANAFNKMVDNLKKLQIQIIQMDRLSSLGQLAGGVAHEINNPLTGVLGQAQLILSQLAPNNPIYQKIKKIENAAQRCRKIVRGLLDFARQQELNFEPTDVNELIEDTLDFCRTDLVKAEVSVITNFSNIPKLNLSKPHIQQVFLNFITNAVDAMPGGGKIFINTKSINNSVLIEFIDTGTGIKKEHLPHIFDPFFTTKEIGKGTGLGLTVSYGIIKDHQGEILVESEGENKGAKFTIKFYEVRNS